MSWIVLGSGGWEWEMVGKWCLIVFFGWVVVGSDEQWWLVMGSGGQLPVVIRYEEVSVEWEWEIAGQWQVVVGSGW